MTEKQRPFKDEIDDEIEDDIMIFSERPNEQIPVPHQMSSISQKAFSSKSIEQKDVCKSKETLSYTELNPDLIYQNEDTFKTYYKEKKRYNDKEETPDMLTKISTPHIEEKLETPESLKGMSREADLLKE